MLQRYRAQGGTPQAGHRAAKARGGGLGKGVPRSSTQRKGSERRGHTGRAQGHGTGQGPGQVMLSRGPRVCLGWVAAKKGAGGNTGTLRGSPKRTGLKKMMGACLGQVLLPYRGTPGLAGVTEETGTPRGAACGAQGWLYWSKRQAKVYTGQSGKQR